jgi:hypothetical protein
VSLATQSNAPPSMSGISLPSLERAAIWKRTPLL